MWCYLEMTTCAATCSYVCIPNKYVFADQRCPIMLSARVGQGRVMSPGRRLLREKSCL